MVLIPCEIIGKKIEKRKGFMTRTGAKDLRKRVARRVEKVAIRGVGDKEEISRKPNPTVIKGNDPQSIGHHRP